jgi:hypothetical protein
MELSFTLLTDTTTNTLYNKVLTMMKVCATSEAMYDIDCSLLFVSRIDTTDAHVIILSIELELIGGKF